MLFHGLVQQKEKSSATQLKPRFRGMFVLRNSISKTACCIFSCPPSNHGGDRLGNFPQEHFSVILQKPKRYLYCSNVPQKNALVHWVDVTLIQTVFLQSQVIRYSLLHFTPQKFSLQFVYIFRADCNFLTKIFLTALIQVCASKHVFRRAIWDKLPESILKILKLPQKNEGNFKIFKNHEGDLSEKSPEPNMRQLVNHTKSTNTVLKLVSFNNGQLQISERAITK